MLSLKEYIANPQFLLFSLLSKIGFWIPDKLYLQLLYYIMTGRRLNLKNPQTFSEKLQWLKLYDRRPEYTVMVDKHSVKDYVARIIGEEYIIPTLGVWDRPEEIDFESLPNQFVLKTTHGGGSVGVIFCKNKPSFNVEKARQSLKKAMKQDIYKASREWPYKNIRKRVLAEKYLEGENGNLDDYKVLCFSGKAKLIEYHVNRFKKHHTQDFYDKHWNKTNLSQGGKDTVSNYTVARPAFLNRMLKLSEILAKGISMCRVDWYIEKGKLYFGEITFFDAGGFEPFDREEDEELLGSWINLSLHQYK